MRAGPSRGRKRESKHLVRDENSQCHSCVSRGGGGGRALHYVAPHIAAQRKTVSRVVKAEGDVHRARRDITFGTSALLHFRRCHTVEILHRPPRWDAREIARLHNAENIQFGENVCKKKKTSSEKRRGLFKKYERVLFRLSKFYLEFICVPSSLLALPSCLAGWNQFFKNKYNNFGNRQNFRRDRSWQRASRQRIVYKTQNLSLFIISTHVNRRKFKLQRLINVFISADEFWNPYIMPNSLVTFNLMNTFAARYAHRAH